MDWANERYVRLYTRDTADDLLLSWQASGLWPLLVRKADRSGVIATNHGARGIAALVRWPPDVVAPALAELLEDGRIAECGDPRGYVIGNYVLAQETPSSDAQRKRDERERRSVRANSSVTKPDNESQNVTKSHERSHGVTNGHSVPSRADPDRADPNRAVPSTDRARARDSNVVDLFGTAGQVAEAKTKRPPKTMTEIPFDWQPKPAHADLAEGLGVTWSAEAGKFRDHHTAKGTRFKDWDAAFRTWLRNASEFAHRDKARHAPRRDALEVALEIANEESKRAT